MPSQPQAKPARSNAERQAAYQARLRQLTPLKRIIHSYTKAPPEDCLFHYTDAEALKASEIQQMIATAQDLAEKLQEDILERVGEIDLNPLQQECRDRFRTKTVRYSFPAY